MLFINVYDFDNTIYKGESTLDFYFFCVRRHPLLLRFVFIVAWTLVKYRMCLVSEDELMNLCSKYVRTFLTECGDVEKLAKEFWKKYKSRIKPFYRDTHKPSDVIVSASFGFLLREIMPEIGVSNLVCSEVDLDEMKIVRLCYRGSKVKIFKELYSDCDVEDFYTDSLNDLPLMKLAKGKVYMVKGEKILEWNINC